MTLYWQDLHHSELTISQLYDVLALRNQVFIVEQHCPYQDIDNQDMQGENRHILGLSDGNLVAYARILVAGEPDKPVKIGRVIVAPEARGMKLGHQLMVQAMESCQRHWPERPVFLAAQAHLQHFYHQFGFQPVSEPYLEDDIPHIDMLNR